MTKNSFHQVFVKAVLVILSYCLVNPVFAEQSPSLTEILSRDYIGELPAQSTQYDFLIGEWDVDVKAFKKDGSVESEMKGIWYAKYLHGKRVLFDDVVLFGENNKLHPGFPSLRTYSPKLGKWVSMHMAPLATQAMCRNIGEWKNNEMHINSVCYKANNEVQGYSRIRFYNITQDSFDYTWEESKDNKNWWLYVTFAGQRR